MNYIMTQNFTTNLLNKKTFETLNCCWTKVIGQVVISQRQFTMTTITTHIQNTIVYKEIK